METTDKNNWAIPAAIVVAGALIAASVFWTRSDKSILGEKEEDADSLDLVGEVIEVSPNDHIKGSPTASVKVITYTDMECPFCKLFHDTMTEVLKKYDENEVAWIYRNFPIKNIHPKAVEEAIAAECVAELRGNDKYWQFVDRFFAVTPSNNQTDLSILPQMATGLGIKLDDFSACVKSGKYDELINKQYNEGIQTGGRGTPWSLVVTKSGRVLSIDGAQPEEVVVQVLNTALSQ